jgi:glycosyltransferase involved in cell wall biosynthesis
MCTLPFVSIGISFYNAEFFLDDAIKAILAQTYPYWELILINDGSTDQSVDIATKYLKLDTSEAYKNNKQRIERTQKERDLGWKVYDDDINKKISSVDFRTPKN